MTWIIIIRNYEKYVKGSIEEKKKLIVGNILKSIKAVKDKGKLNYPQFEEDLLGFLGYTKEELLREADMAFCHDGWDRRSWSMATC